MLLLLSLQQQRVMDVACGAEHIVAGREVHAWAGASMGTWGMETAKTGGALPSCLDSRVEPLPLLKSWSLTELD